MSHRGGHGGCRWRIRGGGAKGQAGGADRRRPVAHRETLKCRLRDATSPGVQSSVLSWMKHGNTGLAPFSTSSRAASRCPRCAARNTGVICRGGLVGGGRGRGGVTQRQGVGAGGGGGGGWGGGGGAAAWRAAAGSVRVCVGGGRSFAVLRPHIHAHQSSPSPRLRGRAGLPGRRCPVLCRPWVLDSPCCVPLAPHAGGAAAPCPLPCRGGHHYCLVAMTHSMPAHRDPPKARLTDCCARTARPRPEPPLTPHTRRPCWFRRATVVFRAWPSLMHCRMPLRSPAAAAAGSGLKTPSPRVARHEATSSEVTPAVCRRRKHTWPPTQPRHQPTRRPQGFSGLARSRGVAPGRGPDLLANWPLLLTLVGAQVDAGQTSRNTRPLGAVGRWRHRQLRCARIALRVHLAHAAAPPRAVWQAKGGRLLCCWPVVRICMPDQRLPPPKKLPGLAGHAPERVRCWYYCRANPPRLALPRQEGVWRWDRRRRETLCVGRWVEGCCAGRR